MNQSSKVEFKGQYIHIDHPDGFLVSPDSTQGLWRLIGDACRRFECWKVLSTSTLPLRVEMRDVDAYQSAVQAMEAARGASIAGCFPGFEPDETARLFMLAAENRGVHVQFFDDEGEALRWLGVSRPADGVA